MREYVNRVGINRVSRVGLGAIATVLIPFAPYSYAQTTNYIQTPNTQTPNIDGVYISGVANTCSFNVGGTFSLDVWNCMAGAVVMTLISQTGTVQPTLDGAYLRSVGNYCSANTAGTFTPEVWDCVAQSVVNDIPFRQGVRDYCSYVYGFLTDSYRACTSRFSAVKQDCYADPEFFALPQNSGFCQPPSVSVATTLYPAGQSQPIRDVRQDRYLANRCESLPPVQQQKVTACRTPGQSPLPQPFIPQPFP